MKKGLKVLGVVALLSLVAWAAWGIKDYVIPTTWRYKITIEIQTPEGLKTGYAVREVRAWKNAAKLINPDVAPIEYEVIGEAVVVDLGKRGVLFGLIDWESYKEVEYAFPKVSSNPSEYLKYYGQLSIGKKAILNINQPKMVTFANLEEPSTARFVYENKLYQNGHTQVDNFEKVFGRGIYLKQVLIEISRDSISSGVESELPFLRAPEKFMEWRRTLKFGNPLIMDRGNFVRKGR